MERKNTHSTNRDGLLLRSESRSAATTSSDFVLQWGNRKRLRCMKVQVNNNDPNGSGPVQRATARVERRVVRSDLNNNSSKDPNSNQHNNINAVKSNGVGNGYLNFRHRPASPSHRILRNSESSIAMRGHSNGVRGLTSLIENHHGSGGAGGSGSSETAHDGGKKGGSPSGGDTIAAVWPPKFVLALTNKEKEEDFMAFKGSKLPQRPKKRAKFIQRTLNILSADPKMNETTATAQPTGNNGDTTPADDVGAGAGASWAAELPISAKIVTTAIATTKALV
ncbi:UNVERIFIED_CONTAM: hypothetical protein Scaly_0898600 [Sesamum calycinum]|uniref:Uncharacterized protein n=1 Tax=Sesamum calycinum TaxID=2727403 RepID=A0AAW2QVW0_9LAMI